MESLLARATRADVVAEPFPHIVLAEALDPRDADRLLASYPAIETVTQGKPYGSNQAFLYSAAKVLDDKSVDPVWRQFIALHASPAFARQVFTLFDDVLPPATRAVVEGRGEDAYGVRGLVDWTTPIHTDAQIGMNTPVTGEVKTVKGPHVDRARALYGGLYYLRSPDDRAEGGDFQLYRLRGDGKGLFDGQHIDLEHVEEVKTVPYRHNTLVLFLNSIAALHGVTPRKVTPHPRYLVNLLAEVKAPLYDSTPYQRDAARATAGAVSSSSWLGRARRVLRRSG